MTEIMTNRKIGILGGTFNPIHMGHLIIAENAYDECHLDEVWLMPAHIPPHKQGQYILADELRLAMVQCAVADKPYFKVSDFEMKLDAVSYTANTLGLLREMYPENEYYFIMGADSLYGIETWYKPEEIFARASILVAARDQASLYDINNKAKILRKRYGADIYIMSVPKIEISSTAIRERVAAGRSINYFVPDPVRDFIYKNRIYEK